MVSGPGVSRVLRENGIIPDQVPKKNFDTDSMLELAKQIIKPNDRILRCRSQRATCKVEKKLHQLGAKVTDCILYENISIKYSSLPQFESVLFASSSAFNAFIEQWGLEVLGGKTSIAIGQPTAQTMASKRYHPTLVLDQSSIPDCIQVYAEYCVNSFLRSMCETRVNSGVQSSIPVRG